MEGCLLRVQPVLNDGTPVERAQVTIVGRRFEQGARPALVFVREQVTDADGIAEFKVPFGVYEVLSMNPREGQTGRVSRMTSTRTGRRPAAARRIARHDDRFRRAHAQPLESRRTLSDGSDGIAEPGRSDTGTCSFPSVTAISLSCNTITASQLAPGQ
jgi:hypothetical protein